MKKILRGTLLSVIMGCFLCLTVQTAFSADMKATKLSGIITKGDNLTSVQTTVITPAVAKASSDIAKISDINLTIKQDDLKFQLPKTVKATLKSGKTTSVNVTWNSEYINIYEVGKTTYLGTVKNYSKKVKLTVTVKPFRADYKPYKPTGWVREAYLTSAKGSGKAVYRFVSQDQGYLNCAFINVGNAPSTVHPIISVLVDDRVVKSITCKNGLKMNEPIILKDVQLDKLPVGSHTVAVIINNNQVIAEGNNDNNTINIKITVDRKVELSKIYYENPAANFKMKIPEGWFTKDDANSQPKKTTESTQSMFSYKELTGGADDIFVKTDMIKVYSIVSPDEVLDSKFVASFTNDFVEGIKMEYDTCTEIDNIIIKIGDNDAYIFNYETSGESVDDGVVTRVTLFLTKIGDVFYLGTGLAMDPQGTNTCNKIINEAFMTFELLEE